MYITADDIEKGISLYYPINNRNGDKISRTNPCLPRLQFL